MYDMFAFPIGRLHERARLILVPGPRISKPDGRKQIQGSKLGSAVGDADANENVLAVGLRVLHKDVEVAVLVEHAAIQELIFGLMLSTPAILLD